MGSVVSSGSTSGEDASVPVVLNVYDLTPLNNYMSWFGVGIFHSGIEVHGLEYGFGAHDFSTSGVFEVEPKTCPGFIYRCSILLGRTKMLPDEFREFIESMASEYHGDTYHLITKNCNHFTDDLSLRLTGRTIPPWVNRLAKLGALCNCLLPEYLHVPDTKQMSEYQGFLSDQSNVPSDSSLISRSQEEGYEFFSIIGATTNHTSEDDDLIQEKHLLASSSAKEVAVVKENTLQGYQIITPHRESCCKSISM